LDDFLASWKYGKLPLVPMEKPFTDLMEKDKPFPTGLQTAFPQPHNPGSLHTFP